MHNRACIRAVATILCMFLAASCVTVKREEAPPLPAPDPAKEYETKGLELLDGPAPELALNLYNINKFRYPTISLDIRLKYAETQKALFAKYAEARDIPRLLIAYANLKAMGASDDEKDALVEKLYRNDLRTREQKATMLDAYYAGKSLDAGVKKAELIPLAAYEKIACHIIVHWTHKTVNGIERTDAPSFSGSGFFIDPTHVLTAYHILEPVFDDSTVTWSAEIKNNGVYYPMKRLVAYDSIDDIAVLEVEKPVDLPADVIGLFGDSAALAPGAEIYCLGNPQGFELTWTRGIVSAVTRRAPEVGAWMQIDAAVSSGASGGLVLGADGRIYGMIVAGTLFGDINFAIPSRTLLQRIDGLLAGECTRLPWLGVLIEEDFEQTGNLIIEEIFPSSWLKATDLRAKDTILELNGTPVKTVLAAQAILQSLPLGSIVKVKACRKTDAVDVDYYVQLASRPEYAMYNAVRDMDRLSTLYTHFGFEVSRKDVVTFSFSLSGKTYTIPIYKVQKIKPKSVLDCYGVRMGDSVGILMDSTRNMTRYVDVIHIPEKVKKIEDVSDLIIELRKGAYNDNIL